MLKKQRLEYSAMLRRNRMLRHNAHRSNACSLFLTRLNYISPRQYEMMTKQGSDRIFFFFLSSFPIYVTRFLYITLFFHKSF